MKFIDSIPWLLVIVACASLGLAPFSPEPHVWEKLKMLGAGNLTQPMDMFDLLIHGTPWVLLVLKLTRYRKTK
jgi:hypothetical protein